MTQQQVSSNVAILLLLGGILFYLSKQNAPLWGIGLIAIVMVGVAGKMVSKLF